MKLYIQCVGLIKTNVMIKDINLDNIYDNLLDKDLIFIHLLKKKKIKINEDTIRKLDILKFIETIVCFLEILEFTKNESLSLSKLNENNSNFDTKNENILILLYLEISSECIKNIVNIFRKLIEQFKVSQDEINKLKNEFVEDLNPINIYDDNEIDLLLNNNTSNNDIEKLINKSKVSYKNKIEQYILKLINKLL